MTDMQTIAGRLPRRPKSRLARLREAEEAAYSKLYEAMNHAEDIPAVLGQEKPDRLLIRARDTAIDEAVAARRSRRIEEITLAEPEQLVARFRRVVKIDGDAPEYLAEAIGCSSQTIRNIVGNDDWIVSTQTREKIEAYLVAREARRP